MGAEGIPIGAVFVQEDGTEVGPVVGFNFVGGDFDLVAQGDFVGVRLSAAAGFVPSSRTLFAGAGLTGGGDLSANRTFNVGANADGSITVNADDIQVGILATDAQHGNRGGGALHALATVLVAGFMSAADKTKLDGIAAEAAPDLLMWGDDSVASTTTTRFLTPFYDDVMSQTTAIQYRLTRAGKLRKLRVRHNTGAGNGNAIVYTLRVNGVATALLVSIASTANDASDLVNSVTVAADDLVDIQVTKALAIGTSPSDITATIEFSN